MCAHACSPLNEKTRLQPRSRFPGCTCMQVFCVLFPLRLETNVFVVVHLVLHPGSPNIDPHIRMCAWGHIQTFANITTSAWAKAFGRFTSAWTSTMPRRSLTRCALATMHGTSSRHEESMCLIGTTTSSGEVNAARAPANRRHVQPQRKHGSQTTLQCCLEARARAKRARGDEILCRVERCRPL